MRVVYVDTGDIEKSKDSEQYLEGSRDTEQDRSWSSRVTESFEGRLILGMDTTRQWAGAISGRLAERSFLAQRLCSASDIWSSPLRQ